MNERVNRIHILPLIIVVGVHALLHISEFPLFINLSVLLILGYRLILHQKNWPLPGRTIRWTMALTTIYLCLQQYGFSWNDETATALLSLGVSLKLIESIKYRDVMICLLMCFYLLMSALLTSQSLFMTVFLVLDVIFIVGFMFRLHVKDSSQLDMREWLRPALKVVLQATPLILLLFFIFPRFSSSFIGLTAPPQAGVGFSENLDPGSVASIAQSDQVAFRAKLENNKRLPLEQLYWRGGTLDISQGLKWKKSKGRSLSDPPQKFSSPLEQEIILEPLFRKWLFSLDYPVQVEFRDGRKNRHIRNKGDGSFRLLKDFQQRIVLNAKSYLATTPQTNIETPGDNNLKTPKNLSSKVLELGQLVEQSANTSLDRADFLMEYMRKSELRYTLKPGKMKTLDELLFNTKKGFCEHFAAAFATLMRLSGEKSRVVIGFHGGEFNPVESYYVVSQKDAHAWAEVWSKEQNRWLRYDPTSVIAPLRIELGGQEFFQLNPDQMAMTVNQIRQNQTSIGKWISSVRHQYDALTYRWNLFLLNYDNRFQKELLKNLGWGKYWQVFLFGLSLISVFIFYFIYRWWQKSQRGKPPAYVEKYKDICAWMAKEGLPKKSSEGPYDFQQRCENKWPEQKPLIRSVFKPYIDYRFAKTSEIMTDSERKTWDNNFKQFKKARGS